MDTVSRRYRKLKGRPSKQKRMCASNISKRWEKDKVENSDISVCSSSIVIEKNSHVIMNNSMWSSLLSKTKYDECNMCSLDVTSNGTYGFSSEIELKFKNCEKIFNAIFSSPRDNTDKCFEANKKLVEAFLKIGKGYAALEVFPLTIVIHAMDKKHFQNV
ncbi:hypothetical protein AVEN_16817-1 [Araneus ventricosus]|uniref:Mutator-like transposase domain-containing protein n=1 Tax=Araneus ventricosus TaxID=182803 RepID=A0A4Y2BQH1_ARAVE|nr:hypothetical protein AVEN_16817-1 [Araneus ventricosus]